MFVLLINASRQFQRTISILQGDIENLELERVNLEKRLELTTSRSTPADLRLRRGPSPYQSPMASPFASRKAGGVASADEEGEGGSVEAAAQDPVLLSRVSVFDKELRSVFGKEWSPVFANCCSRLSH